MEQETELAAQWPAKAAKPTPAWRSLLPRVAILLLSVAIVIVAFRLSRDVIQRFAGYGYLGVFIATLVANATVLIPAPGDAFVFAAGGVLHPVLTGIVAGLGASLGELTGYLAGTSGSAVIAHRAIYNRLEPFLRRYGILAVAVLAFIPNPFFDVAGILSGMLRIPVWQFVLAAWIGKGTRFSLIALGGASALPFLDRFF
ncbi:MAG: VTT domain-containing protein [Anaerolineae bacterium]|nr:VTT domain-containing protein [Anaerolineae bacterium]